jgi:hypothetical protein
MDRLRAHRKTAGLSLGIFALALAFRLPFLGRAALWGDEILFVQYMADVSLSPLRAFLDYWQNCLDFGQLPLAGVAMNVWMHVVGRFVPDVARHVWALRLPGAVAGAVAVVGIYWLGRRLLRPELNRAATAMAAVFYYPVYYSREIYCYPYVLLCAAFAYLYFHKALFDRRSGTGTFIALALWSVALGWTHFGCSVALAGMALLALAWRRRHARRGRRALARRATAAAAACIVGGLAAAPYWLRILTGDSPHIAYESPVPIWGILHDMTAKFFLGDRLVPAALAWLVLLAGLAALARGRTKPGAARTAAGLFVFVAVVLTILAKKSAYPSSRYFALLTPLVYPIFAAGLGTLADVAARTLRQPAAARGLSRAGIGAALLVHLGLFLPDLYRLEEKSVPYATTARWLNAHAEPGAPYFYDSGGFDLRYVPGYYATPELTPAVHIAGNGPLYAADVERIQRDLMRRFPVSYYVRRPGYPWQEPERFYRNIVESQNPPLHRLRRYGIVTEVNTRDYTADLREILYNTPEDALAIAQAAGEPIFVEYPGFRCGRVAEEIYGHVARGAAAELVVHNLRDAPLRGSFRISGALSIAAAEATLELALPGGGRDVLRLPGDRIWTLETPPGDLPVGRSALGLAVSAPAADKLLVMDVQFVAR